MSCRCIVTAVCRHRVPASQVALWAAPALAAAECPDQSLSPGSVRLVRSKGLIRAKRIASGLRLLHLSLGHLEASDPRRPLSCAAASVRIVQIRSFSRIQVVGSCFVLGAIYAKLLAEKRKVRPTLRVCW